MLFFSNPSETKQTCLELLTHINADISKAKLAFDTIEKRPASPAAGA